MELINKDEQNKILSMIKELMHLCPFNIFYLEIEGHNAVIPISKYGYDWVDKATVEDLRRIAVY